jgi:hypothetical protein
VQISEDVSGKIYAFPANDQKLETLGLEFGGSHGEVALVCKSSGGVAQRILCGSKDWRKGRLAFGTLAEQPAAACGAWTADHVYTAKVCFYETPYIVTLHLDFAEQRLRLDSTWNVSFGAAKKRQLIGERK